MSYTDHGHRVIGVTCVYHISYFMFIWYFFIFIHDRLAYKPIAIVLHGFQAVHEYVLHSTDHYMRSQMQQMSICSVSSSSEPSVIEYRMKIFLTSNDFVVYFRCLHTTTFSTCRANVFRVSTYIELPRRKVGLSDRCVLLIPRFRSLSQTYTRVIFVSIQRNVYRIINNYCF